MILFIIQVNPIQVNQILLFFQKSNLPGESPQIESGFDEASTNNKQSSIFWESLR